MTHGIRQLLVVNLAGVYAGMHRDSAVMAVTLRGGQLGDEGSQDLVEHDSSVTGSRCGDRELASPHSAAGWLGLRAATPVMLQVRFDSAGQ